MGSCIGCSLDAALRAQWRALVVLGASWSRSRWPRVVATVSAADRSSTAFDRLRRVTNASDVAVFVDDGSTPAATKASLRQIDGVTATQAEAELFVRPVGHRPVPELHLPRARAPVRAGGEVNVPVVVSGRLPVADRVREVAVSERLAVDLGLEVGDELPLESMTDAWVETSYVGR